MIHVLPQPGIGIGRHGFIKMAALHCLNCSNNLDATISKRGSTTNCWPCDGKPFDGGKSGFKRIKIICWFSLFGHDDYIHHNGVIGKTNVMADARTMHRGQTGSALEMGKCRVKKGGEHPKGT